VAAVTHKVALVAAAAPAAVINRHSSVQTISRRTVVCLAHISIRWTVAVRPTVLPQCHPQCLSCCLVNTHQIYRVKVCDGCMWHRVLWFRLPVTVSKWVISDFVCGTFCMTVTFVQIQIIIIIITWHIMRREWLQLGITMLYKPQASCKQVVGGTSPLLSHSLPLFFPPLFSTPLSLEVDNSAIDRYHYCFIRPMGIFLLCSRDCQARLEIVHCKSLNWTEIFYVCCMLDRPSVV